METTLDLSSLFQQESFDEEACRAVKELAFAGRESLNRFLELLANLERQVESGGVDRAKAARKLGACYLVLGDADKAAGWLEQAEDGCENAYDLGLAYREQRRYAESIAQFEKAAQKGGDTVACDCQRAESMILQGDLDAARQILDQQAAAGKDSAAWHYAMGRYHQEAGELESAIEAYERALALDDEHPQATFHLAYLLHLHGSDEEAKRLYENAAGFAFVHANTLVNLSIIYEDEGQYERAADCLQRVLVVDPNHPRARLYLKDVLATREMYVDEQEVLDAEKRNAVLDIPVSDFELSVRSRNCLKKMNIHTLGDLLRTTEAELLAYKNFGETSLKEILVMLKQKGLSIGQLAHESTGDLPPALQPPGAAAPSVAPEVLEQPVSTLALSVRARKCLQLLGIITVGELIQQSASELLASPNFGETSLDEVQTCLAKLGLSLKET